MRVEQHVRAQRHLVAGRLDVLPQVQVQRHDRQVASQRPLVFGQIALAAGHQAAVLLLRGRLLLELVLGAVGAVAAAVRIVRRLAEPLLGMMLGVLMLLLLVVLRGVALLVVVLLLLVLLELMLAAVVAVLVQSTRGQPHVRGRLERLLGQNVVAELRVGIGQRSHTLKVRLRVTMLLQVKPKRNR